MRVIERQRETHLVGERAVEGVAAGPGRAGEQLDGHDHTTRAVVRAPHLSHPPAPEELYQVEGTDRRIGGGHHSTTIATG
jgi:hypothetical protein